jgi:two-component system cell cycle response regulator
VPLLTKNQVAVRIAAIIAAAELVIMWALSGIPLGSYWALAAIDGTLLVVVSTPPIYFWVIRPFVRARDEALARVNLLAFTDPLTQLANRRRMSELLEKAMQGAFQNNVHGALLLIDLDGFKLINDAYGHQVGDLALAEVARRLRAVMRAEDALGRLGGDEFVVLVNRLDAHEGATRHKAFRIARKILAALNAPMDLNGRTAHVGASIGIRLLGFEPLDPDTGIREADFAMYQAKQAGGGRAAFFERRPLTAAERRLGAAGIDTGSPDPADAPRSRVH